MVVNSDLIKQGNCDRCKLNWQRSLGIAGSSPAIGYPPCVTGMALKPVFSFHSCKPRLNYSIMKAPIINYLFSFDNFFG